MNVQVFLFLLFKLKCFFDKIKHWYLSHTCRSLSRIHIEIAAFFTSFGTVVIIYKRMIYINHSAFHIYIAPSQTCYLADTQSCSYHIVIPAGDSQKVWVKWHTPSTPQTVTITVSVSGAYTAQDTFVAKIVDLNEHIPPDPVATDTNPSYTLPSLPSETQKLTANWGVWSCYWVPVWVWCDHGEDGGHWVDEGYWEYEYTGYSASISGVMSLMPDDIVPTASGKAMKSGYGVKQDVTATLSTDAPTSHITHPQTAFSVFPEFQYQTYLRLLQRVSSGRSAKFTFQPNDFSTYNRTVHFTPIWFPDSTNYTVFTQVWDTWTPDGMLSINLNDYVSINGSLYDDWYSVCTSPATSPQQGTTGFPPKRQGQPSDQAERSWLPQVSE